MPRPNQPRSIAGERGLARRIAHERDSRGMSYEGLALRLTKVGCPIQASAIYKIEKGDPPRRITVDELVAFAEVFGVPVEELLLPPELVTKKELVGLVTAWDAARIEASRAQEAAEAAWDALRDYARTHPEIEEEIEKAIAVWVDYYYEPEQEPRLAHPKDCCRPDRLACAPGGRRGGIPQGVRLMASIKKRDNGKWRARYRDDAGKEHARHFERKVDAQRWLDAVTASVVRGDYVDPRAGPGDSAATTRRAGRRSRCRARARRGSWTTRLRLHILPVLGDRRSGRSVAQRRAGACEGPREQGPGGRVGAEHL